MRPFPVCFRTRLFINGCVQAAPYASRGSWESIESRRTGAFRTRQRGISLAVLFEAASAVCARYSGALADSVEVKPRMPRHTLYSARSCTRSVQHVNYTDSKACMKFARSRNRFRRVKTKRPRVTCALICPRHLCMGRAFGWSGGQSSSTKPLPQQIQAAPLRQRPADTASMRIATIRQESTIVGHGSGALPASALRLSNPRTLCYMNASILALFHVEDVLGARDTALHALRQEVEAAQRLGGSALLPALRSFRSLAPGWDTGPGQQDAAEFSSHVLSRWRAWDSGSLELRKYKASESRTQEPSFYCLCPHLLPQYRT